MKKIMNKFLIPLLIVTGVIASLVSVSAAESVEDMLEQNASAVVEQIAGFGDAEIAQYKTSTDAFTVAAANAWEENREDLGEFEKVNSTNVTNKDGIYTATVDASFSKNDATFEITCDEEGNATGMTINIDYPIGKLMANAGMNTLMGVGIVFVMLIMLSFLIYLFTVVKRASAKKTPAAAPSASAGSAAPSVAAPAVQNRAMDGELAAVIAAAIAASENTSTDSFVVRSIKRANSRNWR